MYACVVEIELPDDPFSVATLSIMDHCILEISVCLSTKLFVSAPHADTKPPESTATAIELACVLVKAEHVTGVKVLLFVPDAPSAEDVAPPEYSCA